MSASPGSQLSATSAPIGTRIPARGMRAVISSPPSVRTWYCGARAKERDLLDTSAHGLLGTRCREHDRLGANGHLDLTAGY